MTPKKKRSKLPLVLFFTAVMAFSFAGGISFGKYSFNGGNNILAKYGINSILKGNTSSADTGSENGESLIEIMPAPKDDDGYDTTYIYKKANPSVVSINVYSNTSISPIGSGTGIIMTSDGYIITNAHVVEQGTSVNVIFEDGSQARGTIIGSDATTDLAVVKVEKTGLQAAEFGDSTALEPGERIIAIGNAGGFSSTITQGVISGLNRDLEQGARSLNLIQVDAAINPGNSGGPLINRFGQVVGINSSKIADVDYEGIGFSIPINEALPILESIMQNGYVAGRAVLGVSVVELNESNGPRNGLPGKGIYIAEINETSDLTSKGVRPRDVILEANGVEVATTDDLITQLDNFAPGDIINLKIYRAETQQTFNVDVLLIEAVE